MGISIAEINVGEVFSGIGSLAKDIRAAITGKAPIDATKAAELEVKLLELEESAKNAQTEINKIEAASSSVFVSGWRPFLGWVCGEAASSSVFVSGWRPFLGWVCGAAFTYNYILMPFIFFVAKLCGSEVELPYLDMGILVTLLFGMLGLGTLRTYEKTKGVAQK